VCFDKGRLRGKNVLQTFLPLKNYPRAAASSAALLVEERKTYNFVLPLNLSVSLFLLNS
jgi:hypothetical protein